MYRATFYTPLFFLSRKRSLTQNVQTFLRLYFFLISFKCFDNLWKRDSLFFSFLKLFWAKVLEKGEYPDGLRLFKETKSFLKIHIYFFVVRKQCEFYGGRNLLEELNENASIGPIDLRFFWCFWKTPKFS